MKSRYQTKLKPKTQNEKYRLRFFDIQMSEKDFQLLD